jgi:hypothetical protein
LIAHRLALWESHVLALQDQLLKFKAELEQRFSSLEAQLPKHSPQLNTFLAQQSDGYQIAPAKLLGMFTADSKQPMQARACPNQTWMDTPTAALPIANHQNNHMPTLPPSAPRVDTPSTLGAVPRQWLSLPEAYMIAQQAGYRLSMYAFRMIATCSRLSIQKYGEYGLGVDPSRRGTAGIAAQWFYLLDQAHL